ncbi:MAG: hypothetical protein HY562_00555 [Ignavibacteriales bacterium]|nr:hypothetical protein [Ignavibacteriales bacterium]
MERFLRLMAPATLATLILLILAFLYSNSRLNEAIERLESVEARLVSSVSSLEAAKETVDSVQRDITTFGSYVRDIQRRVEILDLSQRIADERFRTQRGEMARRLKELYKELEVTGKDLPEIPVVNAERKN